MNFNNPDDVFSSSPLSGDDTAAAFDPVEGTAEDGIIDQADNSSDANDDSQSSARLDAALRQAAAHAGTQRLDLDDDEDMSMVIAEDDITASFKPWAQKSQKTYTQEQDDDDPFSTSPAASAKDDGDEDMSMDITRAVGRIVAQPAPQSPSSDDMSMELTLSLGGIQALGPQEPVNRRKSLKRRASLLDASQGSPAKRPTNRRSSIRRRSAQGESPNQEEQTMDFTTAIGNIKALSSTGPGVGSEIVDSMETPFGDETMEFTVAVGSIKNSTKGFTAHIPGNHRLEEEDLSMEFTTVIGPGIKHLGKGMNTPEKPPAAALHQSAKTKTPTPQRSPKKSPARPKMLDSASPKSSMQQPVKTIIAQPNGRTQSPAVATPEAPRLQQHIEDLEPSPFVRSAPKTAAEPTMNVSTPTSQPRNAALLVPDDPIAAPILKRRRSSLSSVQFSPLAAVREEPTLRSTALLTSNIKLLSTPRKQTLTSPVKRGMTPKKSHTPQKEPTSKQKIPTPKKATPRKSLSPKKRVAFGEEPENKENMGLDSVDESLEEIERISLQEFLELTKIRFMDLSTTKRRHTAAPAAFHDKELEEKEDSLDRYVVAGACTLPEFELYQHACHEMKKYISDGRHFVRTMEANVLEENPLLFSEYLTAPPDQRVIMDNQFKNLKTSARFEARSEWYGWRSTLLQDLKAGLLGTMDGFRKDESLLATQEKALDAVLPDLTSKHEQLDKECKQLQQRHDELNSCDREELEEAREQLTTVNAEIEEKRQLIAQLQRDISDKEAKIDAIKERKVECIEEIKMAERVREECRGWSTTEVSELKSMLLPLPFPSFSSANCSHRQGQRARGGTWVEHHIRFVEHGHHDSCQ